MNIVANYLKHSLWYRSYDQSLQTNATKQDSVYLQKQIFRSDTLYLTRLIKTNMVVSDCHCWISINIMVSINIRAFVTVIDITINIFALSLVVTGP